uniref:SEC-C metal-binding domain-containing protein n=1 Tax=Fulvivirga sp. TaxID=1931237 RepID=UPI004049E18C
MELDINHTSIELIASKINSGYKPSLIPVKTEEYSIDKFCFPNVEQKIKLHGGSSILGWRIWIHSFMVEAELHCIWGSPDGELIDISPSESKEIIFIQDQNIVYNGTQVDNIRINTSNNKLVDLYIDLFSSRYKLLNKGHRKNINHEVQLKDDEVDTYRSLSYFIELTNHMIKNNLSRNSLCQCGSSIKFKRCHEPLITKLISKIDS